MCAFFQSLNRIVQSREPWIPRDTAAMIYRPLEVRWDRKRQALQSLIPEDAGDTHIITPFVKRTLGWSTFYETSYFPAPFYEGGHWFVPAPPEFAAKRCKTSFANPDSYPVDERGHLAYLTGLL